MPSTARSPEMRPMNVCDAVDPLWMAGDNGFNLARRVECGIGSFVLFPLFQSFYSTP